jgi:hypothetical protein
MFAAIAPPAAMRTPFKKSRRVIDLFIPNLRSLKFILSPPEFSAASGQYRRSSPCASTVFRRGFLVS